MGSASAKVTEFSAVPAYNPYLLAIANDYRSIAWLIMVW